MEASYYPVLQKIKKAYGLVKNKKPFFTGPTGSATGLF
jgi:hypothetical protein